MNDNDTPLVSVILPVFNGEPYLATAIDSVCAQSFKHFELLIIDDGSSDNSLAVARQYAEKHPDRIQLLTHRGHRNRGVAASRNLALRNARGTFTAFIDQDDTWLPEKLEQQTAFMQEHPDIALCYTRAGIIRHSRNSRFTPGIEELGDEPPTEFLSALFKVILVELNYIFSAVMVRTTILRNVGGLPEHLPFQSDDRIMVAKVCANHRIARLPKVLTRFRSHDTHYTAGVLASGIGPMIIFDLQYRLVQWLAANGHADVAEYIAYYILPRTYADALSYLRHTGLQTLLKLLFQSREQPQRKRRIHWCLRCMQYRMKWRWHDPLVTLLTTLRDASPWCGRHQIENRINQRDLLTKGDGRSHAATQPDISVILPVYNDGAVLGDTIESILAQTCSNTELLIVDAGSTDASRRIAEAYAQDPQNRISALRHPGNLSTSEAASLNRGLALATGRYVACAQPGDLWDTQKLQLQMDYLDAHPEVGLCLAAAYEAAIDESPDGVRRRPTGRCVHPPATGSLPLYKLLESTYGFVLNTTLIRTDALRSVGGFPARAPQFAAPRITAALVQASRKADGMDMLAGEYCARQTACTNMDMLDMQVLTVLGLLHHRFRRQAVDIAARLVPAAFRRCRREKQPGHMRCYLHNLLRLLLHLPHWPLIVMLFHFRRRSVRRRTPSKTGN
jgi:glycosyltransferase involved in cell wall biosynthesis